VTKLFIITVLFHVYTYWLRPVFVFMLSVFQAILSFLRVWFLYHRLTENTRLRDDWLCVKPDVSLNHIAQRDSILTS